MARRAKILSPDITLDMWRYATIGALFLAWVSLHQPITDACEFVATRYGFLEYDRGVALIFAACGALTLIVLTRGRNQSRATWTALAVLGTLVALSQPLLIINSVENIHFPQYAAIAWLCVRAGLAVDTAWFASTVLGGVDEFYQYLFLRAGRPDPLDWNDIFLNALGAALGLVVMMHVGMLRRDPLRYSWRLIPAVILPLAAVAWWLAPPIFTPFYKVAVGSGFRVHVLSTAEGLLLLGIVCLVVDATARRLASSGLPPA